MDNTQELIKIKEHIVSSKSRIDQLTGQRQQLFKQLKDELNCSNVGDAKVYSKELEQQILASEKEITEDIGTIKESLGW